MKILVAPDKFKGTFSADEVTKTISDELRIQIPQVKIHELPVADGGDGSLEILKHHGFAVVKSRSIDALGREQDVEFGFRQSDATAFIEMAVICGISALSRDELDPRAATSEGLGKVILQALEHGALRIIISVGGSASIDGGSGLLKGIGARLLDRAGEELDGNLSALQAIEKVDFEQSRARLQGIEFLVLADVNNPLVGPSGAVRVYGEQKGLKPSEFDEAEAALGKWAAVLKSSPSLISFPGIGAAGGVALPLVAIFGASVRSGTEFFIDLLNLDNAIQSSDVVITGEGALDEQSFMGKIVGWIIEHSQKMNKKVFVVTGVSRGDSRLSSSELLQLTEIAGDQQAALDDPERFLKEASRQIALRLSSS